MLAGRRHRVVLDHLEGADAVRGRVAREAHCREVAFAQRAA
jgi:hypothetical protein